MVPQHQIHLLDVFNGTSLQKISPNQLFQSISLKSFRAPWVSTILTDILSGRSDPGIVHGSVSQMVIFLEPKSETEKIEKLRLIFTELGAEREAHWQTLKYLFQHFSRYFLLITHIIWAILYGHIKDSKSAC